jgi:hypothetical protein
LSKNTIREHKKLNNWGIKVAGNNKHCLILTLNKKGLNASIKRHGITNWVKKQDPTICCLQKTHLAEKKTNASFESKGGWKKSFPSTWAP